MSEPLLQVVNLAKRFDGVVATENLTLNVAAGELHAVIGPNGAGKTTLVAQLGGQVVPDFRLASTSPELISPHCRFIRAVTWAWHGRSRSHRCSSILPSSITLQWRCRRTPDSSFRFWRNARRDHELRKPALAVLARVGLAERADLLVSALSYGERRLLELAVALAEPSADAAPR